MSDSRKIERVQTGIRIEKRVLKVLKALAADKEMPMGELLEGILLHVFDGRAPFSKQTLRSIGDLKAAYGLNLTHRDSHLLDEGEKT